MTEDQIVERSVAALNNGAVILYPTDTIWGLGCDPFNESSVNRIFHIKKRSKEKGFILLVSSLEMLKKYVREIPTALVQLIEEPQAPLTVVYTNTKDLPDFLLGEDGSIAIRIVQHELVGRIINAFNAPIISTSANTSGHAAPGSFNSIEQVIRESVDLVFPPEFDTAKGTQPSRMARVGKDGTLQWIR